MPNTIKRRLTGWFPHLDSNRQHTREPPDGPRREAERAQDRLMNRARAWAAHWLPNILLNDPSFDNRDDWMQRCTAYLHELLGTD
eukprot:450897-Pyramimonas_sp.AAC.1